MHEKFSQPVDKEEAAMHVEVMAFLLADALDNAPPGWDDALNAHEVAKLKKEVESEWSDEEICQFLEDKGRVFANAELMRAIVDVVEGKIPANLDEEDEEE